MEVMAAQPSLQHFGQLHFLHQAQEQGDIIDSLVLQRYVCWYHASYAMEFPLSGNPSAKDESVAWDWELLRRCFDWFEPSHHCHLQ